MTMTTTPTGVLPSGTDTSWGGATRKRAKSSNHPAAPYGHPDPGETKPSRRHRNHALADTPG